MLKDFIKKFQAWMAEAKSKSVKFIAALLIAYLVFCVALVFHWPKSIVFTAMAFTLAIPFALIVMLLTENPVYRNLYSTQWGKGIIAIVTTVYIGFSYTWAAGEIGGIFSTASTNLPWTTLTLSVVYFFKNVVLTFSGLLLAVIMFYSTYWIIDVFIINYKSFSDFIKRVASGLALVVSVGLITGSAGFVTNKGDEIAKIIAINADFSSKHRCTGEIFENSAGVLFLPSGEVLVAKPKTTEQKIDWQFPAQKCVM